MQTITLLKTFWRTRRLEVVFLRGLKQTANLFTVRLFITSPARSAVFKNVNKGHFMALGQICSDTFLMRAFAQTVPLKQLISQADESEEKTNERTRTIVLTDGLTRLHSITFRQEIGFSFMRSPLQSIRLWSSAALAFNSQCQKSPEWPPQPCVSSHPAALELSEDLHFSLTGLTDIRLFLTVVPQTDTVEA